MTRMSKDALILRGNTEQCPVWSMPELSGPDHPPVSAPSEPATPETSEAHELGYEEGFSQGLEKGHAEGYEAGLKKGLAEGQAKSQEALQKNIESALAPIADLAKNFDQALSHANDALKESLIALALQTGKSLARAHLDANPEIINDIVRELLHTEPMLQNKPRVWLHPQDLVIVQATLGQELDSFGWRLVADDELTPGGCRVTSSDGEMDATWETRWSLIAGKYLSTTP